jgi:DNA-binding GntR family transcriptional regulator
VSGGYIYRQVMVYDPDSQVDPDGRVAPYRQLAGILAARIERGDWAPGRRMASESRLQQEYELSRKTVRRAIAVLVEQGLVEVEPQRGTYVRPAVD